MPRTCRFENFWTKYTATRLPRCSRYRLVIFGIIIGMDYFMWSGTQDFYFCVVSCRKGLQDLLAMHGFRGFWKGGGWYEKTWLLNPRMSSACCEVGLCDGHISILIQCLQKGTLLSKPPSVVSLIRTAVCLLHTDLPLVPLIVNITQP